MDLGTFARKVDISKEYSPRAPKLSQEEFLEELARAFVRLFSGNEFQRTVDRARVLLNRGECSIGPYHTPKEIAMRMTDAGLYRDLQDALTDLPNSLKANAFFGGGRYSFVETDGFYQLHRAPDVKNARGVRVVHQA